MFLDARQLDDASDLRYDVCIAGAGAAGIALALEFAGRRERVCILESGGFEPEEELQSLYEGRNIGLDYHPLDASRLRYFGGTTNHWGGHCIPFDPLSFQERPWIPHSGWPIGWAEVVPYYSRARELLGLPVTGWDAQQARWRIGDIRPGQPVLPLDPNPFVHDTVCVQPVRFGEVFRDRLRSAVNIDVILHANLVDIGLNQDGTRVDRYRLRTFEGKSLTVEAERYVLALGGIENARLLLASNSVRPRGIGNQNDLVGRFFADHVNVDIGYWTPSNPAIDLELYKRRALEGGSASATLRVSAKDQATHQLVGSTVGLNADYADKNRGVRAFTYVGRAVQQGALPDDLGRLLAEIAALQAGIGRAAGGARSPELRP